MIDNQFKYNAPIGDISKTMTFLNDHGVCVIDEYLEADHLEEIQKEFGQFLDSEYEGVEHTDYSLGECARIYKNKFPVSKFTVTNEVFYGDFFRDIASRFYSEKFNLNSEIFAVKDVVGSNHIANDLHYDVIRTLKFFIYLKDTTASNGAFECVPNSHKKTEEYRLKYGSKISFENREITRDLDLDEFEKPIPVEGSAGSLIIFNTDVWHRAGKVTVGERWVMRGHTRPSVGKLKNLINSFTSLVK